MWPTTVRARSFFSFRLSSRRARYPDHPKVTDSDGDGYTDADEQSNGTDPCSSASQPADFNQNHVSDLLDPDDDSDGIPDVSDQLFLDPLNGANTPLPVALEWNPSDPAYGKVANSGFTGVQISSKGPVDQASGHALAVAGIHPGDAGGHLTMWMYPGTAQGAANSQVNALQLGFDSTTNFRIWSSLTQPFTGVTPAPGHEGGVFFGPNQDNYARLALLGTAGGGKALQFGVEVNGTFTETARVNLSATTISTLDIFLVGTPSSRSLTAYYDVNGTGTMTVLGTPAVVPAGWFSNNAGTQGAVSLAGVMVSDGGAAQMAFVYDFFRIDRNVPPPPSSFASGQLAGPSPANGASSVPTTTALTWTAAANATAYDVALGTTNPPPVVSTGQTTTTYQPASPLAAGTVYFWQVIATNGTGSTASPVWTFTTASTPPPPAPEIIADVSDVQGSGIHAASSGSADATAVVGRNQVGEGSVDRMRWFVVIGGVGAASSRAGYRGSGSRRADDNVDGNAQAPRVRPVSARLPRPE